MKKTHRFTPEVSFLSLQDTVILSISLSGITRIYSELRPIQRFSAMAAALETGFPLHDAAMSSLVIGRAVAVWSDLCTRPHAPPV